MPLYARLTITLRPDTEDPDEARQDALDFVSMAKESWYSPITLEGDIEVYEQEDD